MFALPFVRNALLAGSLIAVASGLKQPGSTALAARQAKASA